MEHRTLPSNDCPTAQVFDAGMLVASGPDAGSGETDHLQGAFDNATVGIFQTTPEGRFLRVNPTLARLLGYRSPEAIISTINDIAHELYVDPLRRDEFARMARANGAVMHFESQVYRQGGEVIWISENAWGVRSAAGELVYFEGFVEDITEQKRGEKVARQREAAAATSQAQSQFMANISHEIRTPLNGVIGMLELLRGTELSLQQQRYVRVAGVSADSLLSLLNDVLDFSEIEAGRLEFDRSDYNLHQLLEDIADMFIARVEAKGLDLALHVQAAVPQMVCGDADRLRQVLINLIGNAVKFTEHGSVLVRVDVIDETVDSANVRFSISDTGIGIPRDRMDRLFKSFSQVDASATRKHGGLGLGLSVSKHLVERLGGTIGVESELGVGSTFDFTVPLEKRPQIRDIRRPPASAAELRILAVDDNATNLEILQAHLTNWNYAFAMAKSGAEALAILERAAAEGQPFDMVILDMQMPGMDGLELAHQIKRRAALKDTVLLMLTSTGESMSRERMIARGLSGYLTKPVRQSRLFDAIVVAASGRPLTRGAAPTSAAKRGPATPTFSNARILLAEDNEINQTVASEILFRAGYHCDIVATGRAALELFSDSNYDLILMDCQMPDLDGFEATRAIRQRERDQSTPDAVKHVPIVALTANAAKGDRELCLSAGMDAYVTKPIDPGQLIGTIDSLLTAAQEAERTIGATTENAEANGASPFHLESLLHRCLGDATFCAMILQKFANRSGDLLSRLARTAESGNAAEIALQAHTLKGVAANLSAEDLRSRSAELERLANGGDLQQIAPVLAQVQAEAKRCLQAVPELLMQIGKQA